MTNVIKWRIRRAAMWHEWGQREIHKGFDGKAWRKEPARWPRRRWKHNINISPPPPLAPEPFMIGLGFPHHRRPFCSVQSNHLHISTPTFLKSNSTSSILLSLRLPSYSPSYCFAFQQIFTVLSRPVVTTCPRKTHCHNMPKQSTL